MATPAIVDKLQKIPTKTRAAMFFGLVFAAIVLFIWLVHIPKTNEIKKLDAENTGLLAKIRENDSKIRQLDELKTEVKTLQSRLVILTEQLPPESEVSGLLRQIQELVNKAGLSLKFWKPEKRAPHASGLYEEIPITIKLTGSYHNVALFFDNVSKLTRIVNMLNVKMDQPKIGGNGLMEISINATAMTFAAVEKQAAAAAPTTVKKAKTQ
jgi:type IV pilus assembly protein PilO